MPGFVDGLVEVGFVLIFLIKDTKLIVLYARRALLHFAYILCFNTYIYYRFRKIKLL